MRAQPDDAVGQEQQGAGEHERGEQHHDASVRHRGPGRTPGVHGDRRVERIGR